MKKYFAQIFVILSTLGLGSNSPGVDLKITASVDKTIIGLNQQFTLSIEVSGEGATAAPEPKLPDMEKFAAYTGSGSSQNIQFINGRMSVSKTWNYYFIATQVGKFQIDPAEVHLKGKVYKTQPIHIEITSAPPQAKQDLGRGRKPSVEAEATIEGNLFIEASVDKRKVYQNEPVAVTYKIYTRVNVTSYGISKLPNTAGFWAEEFPLPQQPVTSEKIVDGRKFVVAEIRKLALFPTNPGKKVIGPMEVECDVRVQRQRRHRDLFDSFFDDPFFGRTVRRTLCSEPISIEVLPLPEVGKPANFSGAVGHFSLSANVDKNAVKTNEAVTLKVKIAGKGNIKILPEPKVEIPPDFEVYEPKVSQNIQRKNGIISGNKTFEYVLIPRFAGLQSIKPLEFSYFDLGSKTYKTLKTPEITIDVAKGAEEFFTVGSGLSKEEVMLLGQDIRFIKKSIPNFKEMREYFYKGIPFTILIILPVILVIGSLGYRRHLDKLSGDVAYARSRQANQVAMRRLRKAKRLMDEHSHKEFYAEVSRALLGFLGDKLNISEAGILTDQVEEMLKTREVDGEVVSQYLDCLRTCDYQRFAPSISKDSEMKEFFEKAKRAIVALEKVV